jgi:purine nucleosidase
MKDKIILAKLFLLTAVILTFLGHLDKAQSSASMKDPVIFIGGGTLDDDATSVLLFTYEPIDYRGVITTNSDCIYNFALQTQWKLQSFLGKTSSPIMLSSARGWNPFPIQYRADSILVYQSEFIKEYTDNSQWPPYPSGEAFLKEQLSKAAKTNTPITLLITDPLTTLSNVLNEDKQLEKGIKRVIWMGGAIHVTGNLDPKTLPPESANAKAEWNAYWDPYAVDWIFKNTSFPIVVFPLDVTDQAKLTSEFMNALNAQSTEYKYSKLVYSLYRLVKDQPYFEMWNALTSVYLVRPDIFENPVQMKLSIEIEGSLQGAISQNPRGRDVSVVLNIKDKSSFYSFVLNQLRRN